jgi:hypothetical protein
MFFRATNRLTWNTIIIEAYDEQDALRQLEQAGLGPTGDWTLEEEQGLAPAARLPYAEKALQLRQDRFAFSILPTPALIEDRSRPQPEALDDYQTQTLAQEIAQALLDRFSSQLDEAAAMSRNPTDFQFEVAHIITKDRVSEQLERLAQSNPKWDRPLSADAPVIALAALTAAVIVFIIAAYSLYDWLKRKPGDDKPSVQSLVDQNFYDRIRRKAEKIDRDERRRRRHSP